MAEIFPMYVTNVTETFLTEQTSVTVGFDNAYSLFGSQISS